MEEDTAAVEQSFMTDMPPSAWKIATIVLAAILVTVVVCLILIASGLMKLGLSIL
jgi:hypothetical protein